MNEPTKESAGTMTQEEIEKARHKGHLAYKPFVTEDGKTMVTRDGMLYSVSDGGTVRRKVETPRRMSKKERRKWREEQELQEVANLLKVQQARVDAAVAAMESSNA